MQSWEGFTPKVLLLSVYHTVISLQNLTTNEHVRAPNQGPCCAYHLHELQACPTMSQMRPFEQIGAILNTAEIEVLESLQCRSRSKAP